MHIVYSSLSGPPANFVGYKYLKRIKDSVWCKIMIFNYLIYYFARTYLKQNLRLMKTLM